MSALDRERAPFPAGVWQAIDAAAAAAARTMLTARRFLDVEGPFGLGLTTIEGGGDRRHGPEGDDAVAVMGRAVPVPMLWRSFPLSLRRLSAHLEHGQPLDLTAVDNAAEAVARLEDRLVYYGDPSAGLLGLLGAPGGTEIRGGDWARVDEALRDVLAAVTALDEAGFRGPYALVAAPALYNGLFRRYADSDLLQVEHLGRLCTLGIFKAPIDGAAVVDPRVGRLVIGQDLMAGFAWSDGVQARLYLSESLVLRFDDPAAVCRIALGGG
ncbi:MAG: family 1 encapsulin nanocompartment shell protein [Actinomycetota bacterium]